MLKFHKFFEFFLFCHDPSYVHSSKFHTNFLFVSGYLQLQLGTNNKRQFVTCNKINFLRCLFKNCYPPYFIHVSSVRGRCKCGINWMNSNVPYFQDVIRDRVRSDNMTIRNWSLKCMATFSLLYRKLAKDAFHVFCNELYSHENKNVWVTCVAAIFQLICR